MSDGMIEVLKAYWLHMRGENPYPLFEEINIHELENIWANCFIANVENGKFTYGHFGDEMIAAYAENLEGEQIVEDMLYPESPDFTHKLLETLNADEPMIYDGAFINRENQDIKFRKILAPLGENGVVTHVIGAMIWQKF